jgi:hypothetical protein
MVPHGRSVLLMGSPKGAFPARSQVLGRRPPEPPCLAWCCASPAARRMGRTERGPNLPPWALQGRGVAHVFFFLERTRRLLAGRSQAAALPSTVRLADGTATWSHTCTSDALPRPPRPKGVLSPTGPVGRFATNRIQIDQQITGENPTNGLSQLIYRRASPHSQLNVEKGCAKPGSRCHGDGTHSNNLPG